MVSTGRQNRRHGIRGNSLVEYSLPLVIFFMGAAIVATLSDLPQRLQEYLADTMGGEVQGTSLQVSPLAHGLANNRAAGNIHIRLSDGSILTIENHPGDLLRSIETSGANGTTTELAAGFEEIVRQLHEHGEISDAETRMLIELANQGHRMAALEKLVEDAAAAATSGADYRSTLIEYNGQHYTPRELMKTHLAYHNWEPGMANDPFFTEKIVMRNGVEERAYPRGETGEFVRLYNEVKNAGMLDNPMINSIVTGFSKQIVILSEQVDTVYSSVNDNTALDNLTNEVYSRSTDLNSAGICHTGGGEDSGVNCS